MNVIFIYSYHIPVSAEKPLRTIGEMHFGISYIASLLKERGHRIELVVLSPLSGRKNFDILDKYLKNNTYGMACFTAVTTEYPFMAGIADYIKKNYPEIYLIAGGAHASLCPDEVIKDSFDALCMNEGEYPVLELIEKLYRKENPSGIANLWIKTGKEIEKNAPRPFLQDLDLLPFPEHDVWFQWVNEPVEQNHFINILLGRGCPFSCTYCSNHALRKLTSGKYVRLRNTENIIKELAFIEKKYPAVNNIYFEIETITANADWFYDFAEKLKAFNESISQKFHYSVNVRITPNVDYEAFFKTLKDCNFSSVNIGLESGSERVRKEILNRNYSNDDVINAVKNAKANELKVTFYNLIGLPGETEEDFKETIRLNRLCQPDRHLTSIFYPYPGTILYDRCKARGLLNNINSRLERILPAMDLPEFPKSLVMKYFILFDYYVYRGNRPFTFLLFKTVQNLIKTNVMTYRLGRKLTLLFSQHSH